MAQKDDKPVPGLIDIWKKVISTFTDDDGDFPLANQIGKMEANNTAVFIIDYEDLAYKASSGQTEEHRMDYQILTAAIVEHPEFTREACKLAAFRTLKSRNQTYADFIEKDMKVAFKNTPISKTIGEITHTDLDKIANVHGIVTEVQDPLMFNKTMVYKCHNGHDITVHAEGIKINKPTRCDADECGSSKLRVDASQSLTDTYQQIKIQRKLMGDSSTKIPRELIVMIFGEELADVANPGDYVVCDGAVKAMELSNRSMTALSSFYLDAYLVQVQKEEFVDTDSDLDNKVKNAIRKGHEKDDFKKLVDSISPAIKGGESIKTNLLLMLAGSDPRWLPGKKRHRGEIQMLIVGDAATAKTSLAEYIIQCFNRGIWASGVKGASSAVGLRASVVYDTSTGAGKVSAGAYLMASTKYGGLVVIDEVADMAADDYRSILEATDDRQMITIRKSQVSKEMQVNCASMHLCNPKTPGRRWDDTKNIHENTGLDTPMLTRYDTIWVLRDIMDESTDKGVGKHLVNMISSGMTDEEYQKNRGRFSGMSNVYTPQFLQAWAQYVRKTFHPRLEEGTKSADKLLSFYLTMRKSARKYNERQDEMSKVISKITPRELGNLVRLAEASARAHHRDFVAEEDSAIAIALAKEAMASSGFDPMTGEWKPVSIMKVSPEVEEKDEKEREWEKSWKKRGSIYYDAIQKAAVKVCPNCHGRRYTIEKGFGDEGHQMLCEACNKTGRVDDLFREDDLKDLLYKKMQPPSSTQELQINGIIVTMKREGILMESGGNLLGVGSWEQLEKWASRYA